MELEKWEQTLHGCPWRTTKGAAPCAVKVARTVLNGGDEETYRKATRLVPTQLECGDVHENRAECLFSLLKPYPRVFRGVSKFNLPGYVGFFQFLRNFRQHNAFEQAELILRAALDPAIAHRAKRGEFVKCLDHFDLLQTARN